MRLEQTQTGRFTCDHGSGSGFSLVDVGYPARTTSEGDTFASMIVPQALRAVRREGEDARERNRYIARPRVIVEVAEENTNLHLHGKLFGVGAALKFLCRRSGKFLKDSSDYEGLMYVFR